METIMQELIPQFQSLIGVLDMPYVWPVGLLAAAFLWMTRPRAEIGYIMDSSHLSSGWWEGKTKRPAHRSRQHFEACLE